MNNTPDDLLGNYIKRVRNVSLALRDLVLQAVPEAKERVQKGSNDIDYCVGDGKEPFCAIAPCRSHVNLYFRRGVELEDPKHLLEGTGETMRHVKIRTVTDFKVKSLAKQNTAAAALDRVEDAQPPPPDESVPEAEGGADLPGPPKGDTTLNPHPEPRRERDER